MDRNAFLAFALSFLVLSLWMAWQASQRPQPQPGAAPALEQPAPAEAPGEAPIARAEPEVAPTPAAPAEPTRAPEDALPDEELPFENELVEAVLSSRGAGIVSWRLRHYDTAPDEGAEPVALVVPEGLAMPVLATPLVELGVGDFANAPFRVLERGPRVYGFEAARGDVVVRKRFRFEDDRYLFRLRVEVENRGERTLEPGFGVSVIERVREGSDFRDLGLVALAEGSVERVQLGAFGKPGFFSSLFGGSVERERTFAPPIEWIGSDSHYFLVAVIPEVARDAQAKWLAVEPGEMAMAVVSRAAPVLPGTTVAREFEVYIGPKESERLEAAGAQLERSIQLGWAWFAPVTRAFSTLLRACYAVIPNYGVAIIILTILVRVATFPLASKQMRSMKRLSEMQPRMKAIQEKYKNDRERQSQEMARLMRETGWNPLGGCLPMLLQIPVFIGLYYALQSEIALRQAPFVLWIDDLSRPEALFTIPGVDLPVRLLPILMAVSMFVQQKLTPATTMDPAQRQMMLVMMPLMFGFLFYTFPSGLVLYWLVSNVLAIGQQLWLNKQAETGGK